MMRLSRLDLRFAPPRPRLVRPMNVPRHHIAIFALTLAAAVVAAGMELQPQAMLRASTTPVQETSTAVVGPHDVMVTGRMLRRDVGDGPDLPIRTGSVWVSAAAPAYCGNAVGTDATGRFQVLCNGVMPATELRISALDLAKSERREQRIRVTADQLGTTVEHDVAFPPSAPGSSASPTPADLADSRIFGRVVIEASGGLPVAGARVRIDASGNLLGPVLTDASGRFGVHGHFSSIGCLDLTADAPGFEPLRQRTCGSGTSPRPTLGHNLVLSLRPFAAVQPAVQTPEADVWVEFDMGTGVPIRPGTHGDEPFVEAGFWDTGTVQHSLIRFGHVPDDIDVERAELWLTVLAASSQSHDRDGSREAALLMIAPALSAWDEATVTGRDRPARGDVEASLDVSTGLLRADVTGLIQDWAAGEHPHGWVLTGGFTGEGSPIGATVRFASRESSFAPQLVLFGPRTTAVGTATPTVPDVATQTATSTPPPAPSAAVVTPEGDAWDQRQLRLPWLAGGDARNHSEAPARGAARVTTLNGNPALTGPSPDIPRITEAMQRGALALVGVGPTAMVTPARR